MIYYYALSVLNDVPIYYIKRAFSSRVTSKFGPGTEIFNGPLSSRHILKGSEGVHPPYTENLLYIY